jgi:CheY-like chemotaxis protein
LRQANTALSEANRQLEQESRERDLTNRRLWESNVQLEKARTVAEKASLAKSEFLSSMSHELRTPLNAILGFAQLMELADPSPFQQGQITQILNSGWHLHEMVGEILDLTEIDSGKVSMAMENVALAGVFAECKTMMEPQAELRGVHLSFPSFDHSGFVWADRSRLRQVIVNLLSNAIKYNQALGTVVVECTAITPDRTRISVRDTGVGMSPASLAQLFQPFNRLGQDSRGISGTGIGLVVTKQLVKLMDGVLGVESTVGAGSVFWVELITGGAPESAAGQAQTNGAESLPGPAGAQPRTLLYIEDNSANLMLVEQLIAPRADLRLLTAVNGPLGIELARGARPEVILMDINLPGMSGFEALKILRDDPLTAHIPVVALSSDAMPGDIELGLKAGFFLYLTKPIKVKEFMDTLDGVLKFAEIPAGQRS